MNLNDTNKNYWGAVNANHIPGNNIFPGKELTLCLEPNASILDIGCGSGKMAENLSAEGFTITAIDINAESIINNKKRNSNVDYQVADITQHLPFDDNSFDAIISGFVLVNVIPFDLRQKVVNEMSRVLKNNGIIWINEGSVSEEYNNRYKISNPLLEDSNSFYVYKEKDLNKSITKTDELRQAIKEAKIDRISHHFSEDELQILFSTYTVLYNKTEVVVSPRSNSKIESVVRVMQKNS
jgi:ubiquinone/menaquinone biosynthesis C-methylase UbiE